MTRIWAVIFYHAYEGPVRDDISPAVAGCAGCYQSGASVDYQPWGLTSYE